MDAWKQVADSEEREMLNAIGRVRLVFSASTTDEIDAMGALSRDCGNEPAGASLVFHLIVRRL